MPQSVIVAASSIRDFFQEAITAALKNFALQPDEAIKSYLVDLLCDRARSEDLELDQALSFIMAETQTALPTQSMRQLKQVGDQSLYVTGFFSDSLRRSHLDPSYYILLGGTAYRRLSGVLHRMGRKTRLIFVYAELGREFKRFVQVLSEVKQQTTHTQQDIGDLYEEWLRTGSQVSAQKLRTAGILLIEPPPLKQ